jgi:predicted  nucleic acid-binding Zn-ribbon protein
MNKQEENNPMDVQMQSILEKYQKMVSDLTFQVTIKDEQIKNLQQALQEANNKIAKLDKSAKSVKK